VAFGMIDRMLGGVGNAVSMARALTEIEQNVIDSVVKLMLETLTETWRPLANLAFGIRGRETRPQMMQVAAPNETVVMIVFDVRIGAARGMMNLCVPASIVETGGGHFVQAWHRQRRDPTPTDRAWLAENLARVPMALTARLETSVKMRELLDLVNGDVISLGVPVGKPIELLVGHTTKFNGRLSALGGRVGVTIEGTCLTHGD
jgi:flagellar motor switch protein FliM